MLFRSIFRPTNPVPDSTFGVANTVKNNGNGNGNYNYNNNNNINNNNNTSSTNNNAYNYNNNTNNYNNNSNSSTNTATINTISNYGNNGHKPPINHPTENNGFKPKTVVPDTTKLENQVAEKIQISLRFRYISLTDDLDAEFVNQNKLKESKNNIDKKVEDLICLKSELELGIEEVERKSKELGRWKLLLLFLLF